MRIPVWVFVALLVLAPVAAEEFIFDDSLYSARDIVLDISVEGSVDWSGEASSVQAKLFYFPKSAAGQSITSQSTSPEASINGDALTYSWNSPTPPVRFSHESVIESSYSRPRINEPIQFPYASVPPELDAYLRSEEIIQVTDDIEDQAERIIGDEDDAVRVAFLLGRWVKDNIEYDLNSVTEDASQSSQWVLDNGQGVCDELTSLYIAMLRSQGIPARFVSGLAYTNLEGLDSPWGPHGWAEVWFPDVGWVPYDVTYGQFGFVDATHVSFITSADAKTNAAEYSMRGRGAQLLPASLERDVQLLDREGGVPLYATYDISPALEEVGLGGFNRVDVTLRNDRSSYVATELFLARTSRLSTADYSKSLLLGPNEQRTVSWLVELDDELKTGYQYTFPVAVYTSDGQEYRTEFTASSGGYVASREELALEEEAPSRNDGYLSCDAPRNVPAGETFEVTCEAQGEEVCVEDGCSQDTHTQTLSFDEVGVYNVVATADGQRRVLTISAQDRPAYSISIQAPQSIAFDEVGVINVSLDKLSYSDPRDVEVSLSHALFEQRWEVAQLSKDTVLQLQVKGEQLTSGANEFTASAGNRSASAVVRAQPASFAERVVLWMNSVTGFVLGVSKNF